MRKQVLAVTIGVLLVLSVFSVLQIKPAQATTIFNDGFESNDFAYWSGTGGTGTHSETVATDAKYSGSYSAKLSVTGDSRSWIYKNITQQDQVDFGVWVNFSATPSSGWGLDLIRLVDSDYGLYGTKALIYNDGVDLKWQVWVDDDASTIHTDNSTTPAVTALEWCYVLLKVESGSGGNGNVSLSVNGTEICTLDSLDMDLTGEPEQAFCYIYNYPVTTTVYFDNVVLDNDVGPDTTAPVFSPITSNSTLAGNGTQLSCTISDNVAVSSYIYSTNNTGPWVNATVITCSGSPVTATWNSTWNGTADNVVSAKIYANDTSDNWSVSPQYDFTLTSTYVLGDSEEIRGVFVQSGTFSYTVDWDIIADTLTTYKVNAVFGEFLGFGSGYYDGSPYGDQLGLAIAALHPHGIEVWADMTFFYHSWPNNSYKAMDHAGNYYPSWICPNKVAVRNLIKAQVEDVATNYDIDGFMFDYIRYDVLDMCYCSECTADFETWLGEGTIGDWTPFYPSGARHSEYMEWRVIPVTEMVRDVRSWMLAIKPNLKFSVAAWTLFQNSPTYWRYWIGQDTTDWVAKGYVDMVAPMMYTTNLVDIEDYIETDFKYMVGGPEGKVPLACFITTGVGGAVGVNDFKAVVDKARQTGADGWIIWRYGGPGVDSYGYLIDITPYLGNLTLPDACENENITVSAIASTSATVTWDSTINMTSVVEYSPELFFTPYYLTGSGGFHYWDIDHTPNGTLVSNSSRTTSHTITITGLTVGVTYYYRVQSVGTGTVSSFVFNFTTNNALTVTIIAPTNTTYTVASTISVNFTAAGGTIDQYWFNVKNGSSWVYVSNQTYTTPTTMTGFAIGTQYTFYAYANNTEGATGVATVMFSVSVIGGTTQIIVNVWWANWW